MKQSEAMPVTPSLVTWARERAGYSLSEAEGHFKKIRQWEAGEMFPTYPQVESMSERFKIPVAAFFLPEPPKVPKIDETFRTLSHETMEGIPPNIRLLLRKARAMQISLYELNEGKNPATRLVTRDLEFDPYTGSIDTMVGQLRDYLDAQVEDQLSWDSVEHALENWRNILFDHGVYVFKDAFRQQQYFGFCLFDDEFPIIYLNSSSAKSRQIFSVFHELAHLLFHTSGIDREDEDELHVRSKRSERIETICNEFAGRFLVPDDILDIEVAGLRVTRGSATELARRFSVSREVIYRKFLDRDLITRREYANAVAAWTQERREGSGQGNFYTNQISYLGRQYIGLAFERYYQNRIDTIQLAEYLNIKPKGVPSLEERYLNASLR